MISYPPLAIGSAIEWCMYKSYEANRLRDPHISPESWRKIYINADEYEKIFKESNHV
jgi:hypothetical protein